MASDDFFSAKKAKEFAELIYQANQEAKTTNDGRWITRKGERVPPPQMKNGHLMNALAMLVRRGAGSFNMTPSYKILYKEALSRRREVLIPISQLDTKMQASELGCSFCGRPLMRKEEGYYIQGRGYSETELEALDSFGLPKYTVDGYLLLTGVGIHMECFKAQAMAADQGERPQVKEGGRQIDI